MPDIYLITAPAQRWGIWAAADAALWPAWFVWLRLGLWFGEFVCLFNMSVGQVVKIGGEKWLSTASR